MLKRGLRFRLVGRVVGGGFRSCSMCVLWRRGGGELRGAGVCVLLVCEVFETWLFVYVVVGRCEGESSYCMESLTMSSVTSPLATMPRLDYNNIYMFLLCMNRGWNLELYDTRAISRTSEEIVSEREKLSLFC